MQASSHFPLPVPSVIVSLSAAERGLIAAELVAGLRRGDPQSTRSFFESYAQKVERTLRHLLGGHEDVEDLVHDVFVHALEGLDSLRDPAALGGWLMGITVLTARARLRKQQRRRRWLSLSPNGELPELPSPPTDFEARAAFGSVHQLLRVLRPEDQIALVFHRVEGMTIPVAAEAMGISTGTFKRRLRRGERHLLKLAQRSASLRSWLGEREVS